MSHIVFCQLPHISLVERAVTGLTVFNTRGQPSKPVLSAIRLWSVSDRLSKACGKGLPQASGAWLGEFQEMLFLQWRALNPLRSICTENPYE